MTAIYSEKQPDEAVPFHSGSTGHTAAYIAELDTWNSNGTKPNLEDYFQAVWTDIEIEGDLPAIRESRGDLDQVGWTDIDEQARTPKPVEFAHACEEEFAQSLDARMISWRYKPHTFAVEWDEEGNFVDCFTPDFYLPDAELFIAVIAPDRRIASAKTRQVRLLRRQHPEVRIELFRGEC